MKFFENPFKMPGEDKPVELTTISRTRVVDGFSIPGIINNGGSYFFTDLQVYHDGLVYCWEMADLELLRKKLNSGWVATEVPDGKHISVHGLGYWVVEQGDWLYNKESFYNYIFSLIKRLNPGLENLFNLHGRTVDVIEGVNVSRFGIPDSKPYYVTIEHTYFPKRTGGKGFDIFFRHSDAKLYLAELSIYPDGRIEITHLPEKEILDFSDLWTLIDDKKLLSEPEVGERITVLGLGSFVIKSGEGVTIEQKYQELLDEYNQLCGKEGSIEKCRRILENYKANPGEELKKQLKQAYEAVPDHEKCFVGDMDTRDTEVRRIIYGEEPEY